MPSFASMTTKLASKPNAPAIVEASLVNGRVELSWSKVDPRTKSYIVVKNSKQGWFDTVTDEIKGIDTTRYTDTKITPDTTYFYTVYGVDENGIKSKPSIEVKIISKKVDNVEIQSK
jgi:hypothetical protein